MDFLDKKILVLGANGGIGSALSKELQDRGAIVFGTRRKGDEPIPLAKWFSFDAEKEGLQRLEEISEKIGKLDLVFFCFGTAYYGSFTDMEPKDLEHILHLDFQLPVSFTQFFLKRMVEGHIHIVSAIAGLSPVLKNMSVYTSAKFGLVGFVRALAWELIGKPIKVSVSCPGGTITDLPKNALGNREDFEKLIENLRKNFEEPAVVAKGILDSLDSREVVILPTPASAKMFETFAQKKFTN